MSLCWVITLSGTLLVLVSFLVDQKLLETPRFIFDEIAPYNTFQLISIIGGMGSGSAFTLIVLERCCASIRLKSYEQERHPKIIFFTIITSWLSSIYIGHYLFFSNLDGAVIIYISVFAMVGLSMILGIFIYNHYWNIKKYEYAKNHRLIFTLGQKFQLQENIRMSKLLLRGFTAASIGGFISSLTLLGCFQASAGQFSDLYYVWRALFVLFLMLTSTAYILSACYSLPFWKELFLNKWLLRGRRIQGAENSLAHLQTLEGTKLAFSITIETSKHFDQLKNTWNVQPKT
ncbi:hypothetical protein M3Y97_00777700 [Aphelenchoides bicaudatus]|nr:hypothetical protein M3Y97_00777700 [Aphelenchoides bicaudatus]